MITFFSKWLSSEERGASPQKIILIFAGIVVAGFLLTNMIVGSPIDFYATNGALLFDNPMVTNIPAGDRAFNKNAQGADEGGTQFLMFELEHPSWLRQFLDFGSDVMVNSLGGQ